MNQLRKIAMVSVLSSLLAAASAGAEGGGSAEAKPSPPAPDKPAPATEPNVPAPPAAPALPAPAAPKPVPRPSPAALAPAAPALPAPASAATVDVPVPGDASTPTLVWPGRVERRTPGGGGGSQGVVSSGSFTWTGPGMAGGGGGGPQLGLFAEENLDFESAEQAYRQAIANFDGQRLNAANMLFRLAELYRKQGKAEEAKALYGRVVREFADVQELSRPAFEQLIGTRREGGVQGMTFAPGAAVTFQRRLADVVSRKVVEATETNAAGAGRMQQRLATIVSREPVADQTEGSRKSDESAASADGPGVPVGRLPSEFEGFLGQGGRGAAHTAETAEKPAQRATLESALEEAAQELAAAQGELVPRMRRVEEIRQRLSAIRNFPAHQLPVELVADARFEKLKNEYDEHLLSGKVEAVRAANEGNPALEGYYHRNLDKWVEEVLKPELEISLQIAETALQEARQRKAELGERKRHTEAELRKLPAWNSFR